MASGIVTIFGASDDLIEVAGAITEEFAYRASAITVDGAGDLLAFSEGTILRIAFTAAGIWRITPVVRGWGSVVIEQASEGDAKNYSDRAIISGARWVVHGIAFAGEGRS